MTGAQAAQSPLKGILAMVGGMALLNLSDAVSKVLLQTYPTGEVLCLRQLASMFFILPYAHWSLGLGALRPRNVGGQLLRGLIFIASSSFIFLSLKALPLATVTAITFAGPIFIAVMSVPMLGERVPLRNWIAILVGFLGVLVMVRPGGASFEWALLLPVTAAFFSSVRDVLSRRLSRTDTSIAIMFWSSAVLGLGTSLTAFGGGWKAVDLPSGALIVLGGAVNFGAHFLIIESYRLARAAVVAPFKYSAMLWATILGWILWREMPDAWIWAGVAILIASGIWIARLESGSKA